MVPVASVRTSADTDPFRDERRHAAMGFLDRLMGRGKKAAGDLANASSLRREGMHQEQKARAEERAESAEAVAQRERERAAEHEIKKESER
jgi:uncharacterized protein YjbJ (UPF0337 family)